MDADRLKLAREIVREHLDYPALLDQIADEEDLVNAGVNSGEIIRVALGCEQELDRPLTDIELSRITSVLSVAELLEQEETARTQLADARPAEARTADAQAAGGQSPGASQGAGTGLHAGAGQAASAGPAASEAQDAAQAQAAGAGLGAGADLGAGAGLGAGADLGPGAGLVLETEA